MDLCLYRSISAKLKAITKGVSPHGLIDYISSELTYNHNLGIPTSKRASFFHMIIRRITTGQASRTVERIHYQALREYYMDNVECAFQLFKKAIAMGYYESLAVLASLRILVTKTTVRPEEVFHMLIEARDKCPNCAAMLAYYMWKGYGNGGRPDRELAYDIASAKGTFAEGTFGGGDSNGGGSSYACLVLGLSNCTDQGRFTIDYKKAFRYFLRASIGGLTLATYYVGHMLIKGEGVKANVKKGKMYLLRAGKEGLSDAWFRLAKCYNRGSDKDSALYCCMIAYRRGHPNAQKYFHKLGGTTEQLMMPIPPAYALLECYDSMM
jgi:hypothetical protein